MSSIKSKNTKPEMLIRRGLHAKGIRYKLHDASLPGTPDLVLLKYSAIIEIYGCFWHGHNCNLFKWPKTEKEFWKNKILQNKQRDLTNRKKLVLQGWRILVVWECSLKGRDKLKFEALIELLCNWLRQNEPSMEIQGNTQIDLNMHRDPK